MSAVEHCSGRPPCRSARSAQTDVAVEVPVNRLLRRPPRPTKHQRLLAQALAIERTARGTTPVEHFFNRELEPWPYDPEAAREILAERGWSDRDGDGILDRSGESFSFDLSLGTGNPVRRDAAIIIQSQLAKIGVEVELDIMEFGVMIDRNLEHDFEATLSSWVIDTTLDLKYAFHGDSIEQAHNWGCYRNDEVDRLIDLARRQARPEDATPYLDRIQELIHRDQPYTFLWEPMRINGVSTRVHDARPDALSTFGNLEEWWVASSG